MPWVGEFQLPRTLTNIQEEVGRKIGKEDARMPTDSSPYENYKREMMAKISSAGCSDIHVVKVARKLEEIKKMKDHASNQGKCAKLFFVRPIKMDKEDELQAIRMHASKTTEDDKDLQDMYMAFQPRCYRRSSFMKVLPHLDMNTLPKVLDSVAALLWDLPMELQGDCIISGVAPEHKCHPIRGNGVRIDVKNITQHYHWTPQEGWTNKLQRVRLSQQSKPPQGPHDGMQWGTSLYSTQHEPSYMPHAAAFAPNSYTGYESQASLQQVAMSEDGPGCEVEEVRMGTLGSDAFEWPSLNGVSLPALHTDPANSCPLLPTALFMASAGQGHELPSMQNTTLDSRLEVNGIEGQDGMRFPAPWRSLSELEPMVSIKNTFICVEEEEEEVERKPKSVSSPAQLLFI